MPRASQSFPTIKVYPPEVTRNPYTGKMMKAAVDYQGARRARALVNFATAQLPSFVTPVTDKTAAEFKANGTLPKALLFTSKTETTPMFKARRVAAALSARPSAAAAAGSTTPLRPAAGALALAERADAAGRGARDGGA